MASLHLSNPFLSIIPPSRHLVTKMLLQEAISSVLQGQTDRVDKRSYVHAPRMSFCDFPQLRSNQMGEKILVGDFSLFDNSIGLNGVENFI